MTDPGKSFWQTVPGIITAVAALITAIGGVLGILAQNGMFGRDTGERTEDRPNVSETVDGRPAAEVTAATPAKASNRIPWASATATLVRKDQTSITVKAPTVGLACATESLAFENGQRISLDLVRSIQFDAIYLENSSADGIVTLLDGRQMKDPFDTWNCPVSGRNELGPVEIQLKDIARIDFHR